MSQGLITSVITTVTGLAHVLTDDINSSAALRDQTQDLYQVPIAVKNAESKRRQVYELFTHDIIQT